MARKMIPEDDDGWRKRLRAILQKELETGGVLFGDRQDGTYVARTKDGDHVIKPGQGKEFIRKMSKR